MRERRHVRDRAFRRRGTLARARVHAAGGFPLAEFVQGSFVPHLPDPDGPHDVLVEFTPRMAPYATSRAWHDSQRTETQPDGSVRVSLRVAALAPVSSWVLEWGPEAVALAPTKLVAMIADDAHRLAARYSSSLDSSS